MVAARLAALDRILEKFQPEPEAQDRRFFGCDWLLTAGFAIAGALLSWWSFRALGNALDTEGSFNIWFQADNPRVIANLLDPASDQWRAPVHPLVAIFFLPWLAPLSKMIGIAPLAGAKCVVLFCAAGSSAALFAALRFLDLPRLAAGLFATLFLASSSFIFWYGEIEIPPLEGLSVCLMLLVFAIGPVREACWAAASLMTLAFTITNWSIGLLATLARWSVKRVMRISGVVLVSAVLLAALQHAAYPTATPFYRLGVVAAERHRVELDSTHWHPLDNLAVLLASSVVTWPCNVELQDGFQVITNQQWNPAKAGFENLFAIALWLVVFLLGIVGASSPTARRKALWIGMMVLGQLVLGLLYGNVSFLYVTNIAPLLIVIAAFSWFGPSAVKRASLCLTSLLIILAAANNLSRFQDAAGTANAIVRSGGNPVTAEYRAGPFILPVPAKSHE